MKNIILLLALTLTINLKTTTAQEGDHIFNLNYGYSLILSPISAIKIPTTSVSESGVYTTESSLTFNSKPAFQLNYEKLFSDRVGLGISAAYQQLSVMSSLAANQDGEQLGFDGKANINRSSIALRLTWRYGKASNLDLYSGFNIGLTNWSVNSDLDLSLLLDELDINSLNVEGKSKASILLPHIHFTALGIRGNIYKHVGITTEIGLGSPYFLSFGVHYKLPSKN